MCPPQYQLKEIKAKVSRAFPSDFAELILLRFAVRLLKIYMLVS